MKNNKITALDLADIEMVSGGDIFDTAKEVGRMPTKIRDGFEEILITIWNLF